MSILGSKFPDIKNVKISFIKIGGDKTINITNTFNLSLDHFKDLPDEKKKQLRDFLSSEIKQDMPLLKEETNKNAEIVREADIDESDKDLLSFYEEKLSEDYLNALQVSLVVRNMAKQGVDISSAKADISKKFPSFGKNLCNLANESYFHKDFKELYSSMKDEDGFSPDSYKKLVERIVGGLIYTVFVSGIDSPESKTREIKSKLNRLKMYGVSKSLLVHAIGEDNVMKAEKIVEEFKEIEIKKTKTRFTAVIKFSFSETVK